MSSGRVVLYAAQSLPASSVACAVRCFHLAQAMGRQGIAVDVWSHTASAYDTAMLLPFPPNRLPIAIRLAAEVGMGVEVALRLIALRLFRARTVVILSSPPYVSCFIAAWACRILGLRFVFDARDVYPEVLFNLRILDKCSLVGRLLTKATNSLYAAALMVSTPSDAFAALIRRNTSDDSKVRVIRNGYDDRFYAESYARPERSTPFICVFHGLLGRMHNVQLLLRVAERVWSKREDVRFQVVGYGPKEALLRAAVPPNVEYLGPKPFHEIPAFLGQADLGLAFIEDTDGTDGAFPVKVYEYLGAGLPCLVTPHGEAGRLVSGLGMGAVFENSQVDEIAQTIVDLARGSPQLAEWRAAVDQERHAFGRKQWSDAFASELQRLAFDEQ